MKKCTHPPPRTGAALPQSRSAVGSVVVICRQFWKQDFGKAALEAFVRRGDDVAAVFCAPEKGRPDPLRLAAMSRAIAEHVARSFDARVCTPAYDALFARGYIAENSMHSTGLAIDLDTCVGCQACATSCKEWNTQAYSAPLSDVNPYGADPKIGRAHV